MAFRMNMKETPVRAGTFHAIVRDARQLETKNGDPMVVADWELLEGPDQGRRVPQFVCFVPQMVSANNHILRVLGQPHTDEVDIEAEDWKEREAIVKVAVGPKGPTVTDIDYIDKQLAKPGHPSKAARTPTDDDAPPF